MVIKHASGHKKIADLFCGLGNFTFALNADGFDIVGNGTNLDYCRKLAINNGVNDNVVFWGNRNDVAEILKAEEEKDRPVNVSMDCLSGETLGKSLPYMARGGYWIVISTLAGIETNIQLRPLLTKGLHLVGSMLRNRTPEFKAQILSELVSKVWPKIESGEIKPSIYKILPMTEAAEAHAILQRGENVGKVVLTVN